MDQTLDSLQRVLLVLNQQYGLNLALDERGRCAFVDEQGVQFQIQQNGAESMVITAEVGQVPSADATKLLDMLQFNAAVASEGMNLALAQDAQTLVLLRTLGKDTMGQDSPDTWLVPFIERARWVKDTLRKDVSLAGSVAQMPGGTAGAMNYSLMKWG